MMRLRKGITSVAAIAATALFAESAFAIGFGAYLRSGIGGNSKGSDQVCCQVAGATTM